MKKIRYGFCTFLISVVTLLLVFWRVGITPFGDKTIIVWDMEWQFSAFMSWFSSVLHGDADFWYSLRGALGGSSIGLYAYYLASPLNFLLVFFSEKTLPYAVLTIMIIKTGLSGAFMQCKLYAKREDALSIIFGIIYALSSFAICFQYNTMWMDAYLMLPLIAIGIDRIIDNDIKESVAKDGLFYCIVLGITLMSNYYIGYMICLFCVIYFGAGLLEKRLQKADIRYGRVFGRFAGLSVLGGGISAFVLLPGVLTLQNSSSGRVLGLKDILDFSINFNPISEIKYIFAGAFDNGQGILGEYPMIYAGAATVLLAIYFFLSRDISKEKKITRAILFLILGISMLVRGLFLVWSGFSMPSGCHQRFAFLWVFIAIFTAYEACEAISINKALIISSAITLALMIIVIATNAFRISYVLNIIFIAVAVACLIKHAGGVSDRADTIILVVLLLVTMAELTYNGAKVHTEQFEDDMYLSYSDYHNSYDMYNELAKNNEADTESYRSVVIGGLGDCFNQGYLRGINSINMYASTESESTWQIYAVLGLGAPDWESENEFDAFTTGLTADLLGVRYIYDLDIAKYNEMSKINQVSNVCLFENADALPLGFLVKETALDITYDKLTADDGQIDVYDTSNRLFAALAGADSEASLFEIIEDDTDGLDDFEEYEKTKENRIYRQPDGLYTDGVKIASENDELLHDAVLATAAFTDSFEINNSKINATFTNNTDHILYACITVPYEEYWDARVDGSKCEVKKGMGGFVLVAVEPGTHEINLTYRTRGLAAGVAASTICILILIVCFVWRRKKINGKQI